MKDRFFSKLDWAAFWTATLVVFAVYFWTLGPSVGLEDSGELATAGAHLGVPHPPGYPFWTLCSWIFCKLFFWVSYMGHPTPAWAISCFSAVAGALAAGCTAMLICRSSLDFIGGDDAKSRWLAFAGAVAGALTFALSPVEWSQSTIVEIYSLNALFLMWVFLLSYRWMRKPSDKMLWFTAFVFGLGLTNYQVLVFAIVPLAIIIALKNIGLFRDVFIYLIPVALTCQVLQVGSLQRANMYMQNDVIAKHVAIVETARAPSSLFIALGVIVLVCSLAAAAAMRKRAPQKAREILLYGGGAGAAAMVLAATIFTGKEDWHGACEAIAPLVEPWRYAAIAAFAAASVVAAALAAFEAPGDSGDEKPLGLRDAIVEYPKALFRNAKVAKLLAIAGGLAVCAIVLAASVPAADTAGYRGPAYPWWKSTSVFWALAILMVALAATTKKGLCFAIPVAGLQIAAFTLLKNGAMNGLTHPASWWFCWPIAWNFVLLALVWITLPHGRSVAGAAFFTQLGVSFYAYMPIVSDLRNPPMNWGFPRTWEGFKHAIMRGQYEAIGFQMPNWGQIKSYFEDVRVQFTDLLIPFALVPFAAGHWTVGKENRKAFWQWMIPAFVCFLLMSVLLVGLANVKGDLQDGFIQKVKFISSHAMLALWIGYGLVFAGVLCLKGRARAEAKGWRFAKGERRFVLGLAVLMVAVSLVYPLVDNYCGNYALGVNEVAFKLGGSEQNGHTFGWQFGAYQLDGAKAIKEQLTADEEPLPDPDWPEPMKPFSIFFGGTDPGRFVPTYMIYSANYRPDIYLITQNALADDTYMAVERDLYGDEIWIPAKEDSAEAFSVYIDEVHRGVRQANGDIKIENGRVQVTGALGVMEINGILTKMMWEHDRTRHDFYIEESYVIGWMYPYLSPHGLIMKINRDKTPYDEKTAKRDRDFWDWYVRRLLKDPMYRRDFAGQKSFSKLRAAIAGLYARQGRSVEAAQAFRESVMLYPASPEAAFRYSQEVLMPLRKWDTVLDLMAYTDHLDPNNTRTGRLRALVEHLKGVYKRLDELQDKRRRGALSPVENIMLAQAYYELGRTAEAALLVKGRVETATSPNELLAISTILLAAHFDADAEKCLAKYVTQKPEGSFEAWLNLCKLQHKGGRKQAALRSLRQALKLNQNEVIERMKDDQDLYDVALPLLQRGSGGGARGAYAK